MDFYDILLAQKTSGGGGGGGSSFSVFNFENRELSVSTVSVIESSVTIEGGSTE